MRTVLQRFVAFNAENTAPEIYLALGLVYLILLAVSISSLVKSSMSHKWLWFLVMLAMPVLGMYVYALTALVRADYTFLARFGLVGSKLAAMSRGNS